MNNQNLDIRKMGIESLKALCYDLIGQRDTTQNNINIINQEIQKRMMDEEKASEAPVETPAESTPAPEATPEAEKAPE